VATLEGWLASRGDFLIPGEGDTPSLDSAISGQGLGPGIGLGHGIHTRGETRYKSPDPSRNARRWQNPVPMALAELLVDR
jgi:hypothetical protein